MDSICTELYCTDVHDFSQHSFSTKIKLMYIMVLVVFL